jgi:SWIB/MDM2 domain
MQWKLSTSRQSVQSELSAMPRGDLTKKLWNYIKKNKLQEDEKKRGL